MDRAEDFQGRVTILYDIVTVGTYHYAFVQRHTMYTKNELQCELQTLGNYEVSV